MRGAATDAREARALISSPRYRFTDRVTVRHHRGSLCAITGSRISVRLGSLERRLTR